MAPRCSHCDDIEIAAGATLLSLASPDLRVHYVVCAGSPQRHAEAVTAFIAILGTWVGALTAAAGIIAMVPLWITGARPWLLTISTALTIAYVAVQLSPVGELVKVWMLD